MRRSSPDRLENVILVVHPSAVWRAQITEKLSQFCRVLSASSLEVGWSRMAKFEADHVVAVLDPRSHADLKFVARVRQELKLGCVGLVPPAARTADRDRFWGVNISAIFDDPAQLSGPGETDLGPMVQRCRSLVDRSRRVSKGRSVGAVRPPYERSSIERGRQGRRVRRSRRATQGTGESGAQRTTAACAQGPRPARADATPVRVIAIGVSTGGPEALRILLPRLTLDLPPILITQHIQRGYSEALARDLDECYALKVVQARAGMELVRGTAYLAPADQHMLVRRVGGHARISLNQDPPCNRHRPSVDVLLNSVAKAFGRAAVGVILTGMGHDGAQGFARMFAEGATTYAQDAASCRVFGMPRAAVAEGGVTEVVDLVTLAERLGAFAPLAAAS